MAYRVATKGYDPKDPVIRRKLGIPVYIEQTICKAKRRCDGQLFIPNVPWRTSCYDCSPPRR